MMPKTKVFEVFSMVKGGWKTKRLTKKMCLEPSGKITIQWETEEITETFHVSEVH